MRDFDEERERDEEEQEDDLAFGKTKKSAVLELEEDMDIIHGDDAEFEAADDPSLDEDGGENGPVLYEAEEEDLSLQF